MIVDAGMQRVEVVNAVLVGTAALRINDRLLDREPRCVLDNPRVTVALIDAGSGEQPHPSIADMDLQAVAVMLDFVHPQRADGRPLGHGRQARRYEGRRSAEGSPPRSLDTTPLHKLTRTDTLPKLSLIHI